MLPWVLAALLVAAAAARPTAVAPSVSLHASAEGPGYGEKKVDVDLFVMSKCP